MYDILLGRFVVLSWTRGCQQAWKRELQSKQLLDSRAATPAVQLLSLLRGWLEEEMSILRGRTSMPVGGLSGEKGSGIVFWGCYTHVRMSSYLDWRRSHIYRELAK